ncbi:MAG: NAD(P)H-hydrate dehydratase [Oscillospiraceae bacterium]|nr:NAD(P)H-hydrate dehydratase [Oscillospiraceae bacterium]
MEFKKVVSTTEMKQAEKNAVEQMGLSYLRLMENAGSAAFRLIADEIGLEQKRFVLLCGVGNNGGDGFVVARKLLERDCVTTVICTGFPKTDDARDMYEKLRAMDAEILMLGLDSLERIKDRLDACEVIVDAVFGTGFHGELPESVAALFQIANAVTAERVSLDMPSGVNSDTGEADPSAFLPTLTISFAALKTAHIHPMASTLCGRIEAVNIGMEPTCFDGMGFSLCSLDLETVQEILPQRRAETHKGSYGRLLAVVGSKNMMGAAVLSTSSALRGGAGLVTVATTDSVANTVAAHMSEAIYLRLPETADGEIGAEGLREVVNTLLRSTACLIGCGLGCSENTARILRTVLENSTVPVIVDADGINCLSRDINIIRTANAPLVLTPHMGEMSRLIKRPIAEIAADRFRIARDFAKEWNVTLVLKDYITVIASPDGGLYLNTAGNPGMAKGGSGDVLAGLIAALIAQGIDPTLAAAAGVHLHAVCGDRVASRLSQYGMLPSDMIGELPLLFQSINR